MWLTKRKPANMLSTIDSVSRKALKEITSRSSHKVNSEASNVMRWVDVNNCNWHYSVDESVRTARMTKDEMEMVYKIAFEKGVTPSTVLSAAVH